MFSNTQKGWHLIKVLWSQKDFLWQCENLPEKKGFLVFSAVIHFINSALWNEILFPWTRQACLECLELRWIKHFFIMKHKLLVQLFSFWNEKVKCSEVQFSVFQEGPGVEWKALDAVGFSVQQWNILMDIPGLIHEERCFWLSVMRREWAAWPFCVCVKTNSVLFVQRFHEFSVEKQIDHGLVQFSTKG